MKDVIDSTHSFGSFFSWECLSETVAIKRCDKSFVVYKSTGIPQAITWFFNADTLKHPDRIDIVIEYKGKEYTGYLAKAPVHNSVKMYWEAALKKEFDSIVSQCTGFPTARYIKISENRYQVDFIDLDSVLHDDPFPRETVVQPVSEGKKVFVWTTRYERSVINRKACIGIHGTKCAACGFDFESVYGELGKDFIEVHHLKPLSDVNEVMDVNPDTDLIPLCSNCHSMIHRRKNKVLTLEELKDIIRQNKHGQTE